MVVRLHSTQSLFLFIQRLDINVNANLLLPEVVIWMGIFIMPILTWSEDSHRTDYAVYCFFHWDRGIMVGVTCSGVQLAHLTVVGSRVLWISLRQFVAPDMEDKIFKGLKPLIALKTVVVLHWNCMLIERHHVWKVPIAVFSETFPVSHSVYTWN